MVVLTALPLRASDPPRLYSSVLTALESCRVTWCWECESDEGGFVGRSVYVKDRRRTVMSRCGTVLRGMTSGHTGYARVWFYVDRICSRSEVEVPVEQPRAASHALALKPFDLLTLFSSAVIAVHTNLLRRGLFCIDGSHDSTGRKALETSNSRFQSGAVLFRPLQNGHGLALQKSI